MKSVVYLMLLLSVSPDGLAQTALKKVVISNGGQWTSNAAYRANLTIGQSIAMKSESENGEACIGFWYEIKDAPLNKLKLEKFNFPQAILRTPRNTISELKVYPNPVFDHATIEFEIAEKGMVRLSLIDVQGREVEVILNKNLSSGKFKVKYNPTQKWPGIFTILLTTNGEALNKNIILKR